MSAAAWRSSSAISVTMLRLCGRSSEPSSARLLARSRSTAFASRRLGLGAIGVVFGSDAAPGTEAWSVVVDSSGGAVC